MNPPATSKISLSVRITDSLQPPVQWLTLRSVGIDFPDQSDEIRVTDCRALRNAIREHGADAHLLVSQHCGPTYPHLRVQAHLVSDTKTGSDALIGTGEWQASGSIFWEARQPWTRCSALGSAGHHCDT